MNEALAMVGVGAGCAVALLIWSPEAAEWAAQYLAARASALRLARRVYRKRFEELRPATGRELRKGA